MDNAGGHRNKYVWEAIERSGNQYLHTVPYTPKTNPIEMWFNQLKHFLKLNRKVLMYDALKKSVSGAISKIKPKNYNNYFMYAFQKDHFKMPSNQSTRRRTLKRYKD
tara:strand:- start:506 stop:826 length:321 start_codon:yes stop_codon:yes gene_type:complete